MNGLSRMLLIFGVFVLGAIFPYVGSYDYLIKYMVMVMLFLSFISMPIAGNPIRRTHVWILLGNLALGFVPYLILKPFSSEYALAAFMTGIGPTAIAAPVIILLIHRNVSFVATSVLITNLAVAIILPLTLPYLAGEALDISLSKILMEVMGVMVLPFAIAIGMRFGLPQATGVIRKFNRFSFFIWITVIWITVSKTTVYLKSQDDVSLRQLVTIAAISMTICILSFVVGYIIGGKSMNREASQSLGQKHSMLSIWVSLAYLNPFIAMGPTFYILFHHIYNGWLVVRYGDKRQ